jgi:DNA-binding LacI/PurR family transcriptional regulator/signal transduction histidine kinase
MAYDMKGYGAPLRIGVLAAGLEASYARKLWKGILERAAERGAEVVGFIGGELGGPSAPRKAANAAYRLAGSGCVDGLVVLSSMMGPRSGGPGAPGGVDGLIRGIGLPAVSVGYEYEDIPSVSASGERAMAELACHIVRDHGARRVALVAGPEGHPESELREASFREALALSGIELDEALLERGGFCRDGGAAAAERLVDSGRGFDAIVCLNDCMAVGAIGALRRRGLAAPFDAAVTGFDDVGEAARSSPSLTTIRQPTREMARAAVDMALGLIAGEAAPSRRFDCELVVRESCGCGSALPLDEDLADADRLVGGEALAEIEECARREDGRGAARALERALLLGSDDPEAPAAWRPRLYALRSRLARELGPSAGESGRIGWLDQCLALIDDIGRRLEAERCSKEAERRAADGRRALDLLGRFSLDALVRRWELCAKAMGIPRSRLVLFEGPPEAGERALPARSRLVEAAPAREGLVEERFPSERLFPDRMRLGGGPAAWLVEPLAYQDEALGYLLVDGGGEEPGAYETLREIMSSAVKGALLLGEIKDSERELEREVYFRTAELREANRGLVGQIEQRRELEREVQEISNRTMQAIGQDLHDDLCPHLVGISMLVSVLESNLASAGSAGVESAREIHELLRTAIERSRQFARKLYPPRLAEEGIASAIEDLVETQGRSAGGVSISLQTEGDCAMGDVDRSLSLFRIIQEALTNALRHSGSDDIIVRLVRREDSLLAEVRDFGRGMPPGDPGKAAAAEGRGMGLRIMRYRAEAIGARLEISNLDPGMRVSCFLSDG